jgi:hypothetical protein
MSGHTPGPWRYDIDECAIVSESQFEETGFGPAPVIVVDLTGSMDGTDTIADAHLIAAAPCLLEALVIIRTCWAGHAETCAFAKDYGKKCDCDWPEIAAKCDAAIAKAHGA